MPPASPLPVTDRSNGLPYFGVFDLFKVGIGPSSSHSVGPMRAAGMFLDELRSEQLLPTTQRIQIDLYGSLALTGIGHGTNIAVQMGLLGEKPDLIDPTTIESKLARIRTERTILLGNEQRVAFDEDSDIVFNFNIVLDAHPNGIRFQAFGSRERTEAIHSATYFSVGGGFVVREGDDSHASSSESVSVPYPFCSAKDLLELADREKCSLSQLARENERAFRTDQQISEGLQHIWSVMRECVDRGCHQEGILPGGLNIKRRAPELFQKLTQRDEAMVADPLSVMDWVNLYAMAVNEENAAGGRVVTAPTNGAAGIVPAVMHYFDKFCTGSSPEKLEQFLLTAAVIGSLYKRNASISGADVGCQGEVGVACSMAAGALTEVLGGTPRQVEQAAEIGMEHNLGLTCDPIRGLVQVPCIERNAMGAVKAINASRLALRGDGTHFVSLDQVIRVMKRTGEDMSSRYKETSQGGLAVNISEC